MKNATRGIVEISKNDAKDCSPGRRFIRVEGFRVHYADQGRGDSVVLLLHGFGGSLDNWLFNLAAVAENHRVLAMDLPGHGLSDKTIPGSSLSGMSAFVGKFLESLDVESAHVVGHSMGGAIAISLAQTCPRLVKSLGLVCSTSLGAEINGDYLKGFVQAQSRSELKPMLQLLFADQSLVNDRLVDDLLAYKQIVGVEESLRALSESNFQGVQQPVLANELSACGNPILVIWGNQDRIVPVEHAWNFPGAKVEVISNAGHLVQMEKAREFNCRLLAFLG